MAVATAARQKLRDDGGDADDTDNAVRRVIKPIFNSYCALLDVSDYAKTTENIHNICLLVIEWTISNLDLSHYYLLNLKITKSGLSVPIEVPILLARPPNFGAPQNHTEFLHT